MSSVRKDKQKQLVDYIKIHSQDGKLTQSLVEIGKVLGYSNATIHRGLHALEQKGIIEVTPSEKPTEPNTIFYRGSKTEVDEFLSKGVQLVKEVEDLSVRMQEFLEMAKSITEGLQDQVKIQGAIQNNSVTKDIAPLTSTSDHTQQ